jgi:MFS transporter, putative metabolite:H+ symporter
MNSASIQNSYRPGGISSKALALGIIVSALGFFVDLYDIMALGAVGEASLNGIGITDKAGLEKGITALQNWQMAGMLIGGFLWGVVGDKYGRLKVLFGSIILYSLFTLLNAFVTDINQYCICRFLAGLGLAGELGAGITLVSEQMRKEKRGLGPAIIAGFGVLGAIAAVIIGKRYNWQTVFIVGGVLGFCLLILRVGVVESGLFKMAQQTKAARGNFLIILRNKTHLKKFLCILLVGIPGWYANGILIQLTPYVSESMGMTVIPSKGTVIIYFFLSLCIGDVMGGVISQWLKSRKKSIYLFLSLHVVMLILFFTVAKTSVQLYYIIFAGIGFSVGFVIQLFTLAAENFGTNIRTLVTSSGLNLVRAWVIPCSLVYAWLNNHFAVAKWQSAAIIGFTAVVMALLALTQLDETFNNDLEFVNE